MADSFFTKALRFLLERVLHVPKPFPWRRFIIMFLGIVLLGTGIGLFKLSCFGNDCSSAMVLAINDTLHMDFAVTLLLVNCVWFTVEIAFGRDMIGPGTFVNWFFTGVFASAFMKVAGPYLTFESLLPRLCVLIIGVLVLSFACALYQTADMGIAPYDSHSLLMARHSRIPYFWCRIMTDAACLVVTLLLHGLIGLGTLICAFGLGPFVAFFSHTVAWRICGTPKPAR